MNKSTFFIRLVLGLFVLLFLFNLHLFFLSLIVGTYLFSCFFICVFLAKILSGTQLFWLGKLLDFIVIFVLIYFTGGRESPFFFLLFMPPLETALTKDVNKTDVIALFSLLFIVYFFIKNGLDYSFNFWLFLFLYIGALGLISYLALKLSALREELLQKENIQRYLLSSLSAGLLFLDADFRLISWNPRAKEILGEMKKGQTLKEVLGREVQERTSRGELKVKDRILGYSLFPLKRERDLLGWSFLFQDITELKKQEERLKEAEKLASLGTMAAGLIHEIKNPLASISGGVQFLREHLEGSPETTEILEVMSREIERLNRLVTNFLFFARPERGEKEIVDLHSLLQDILESHRSLFSEMKLEVSLPKGPLEINKEQWRQILENLLINAAEACKETGRKEIGVNTESRNDHYLISVKDRGPGIKEEMRSRIFEPFYTTKPQGTGLGLAVVYRIVENLKGEIKVFSEEGEGTTLEIKIPKE